LSILTRSAFLKASFCLLLCSEASAQSAPRDNSLFTIDSEASPTVPETGYLHMGSAAAAKSPNGHTLLVNSRFLTLDGKPWLPVMGEFHFSRYPERYWEEEILKMKAGGIQIAATYVFWIHHEEVEGQFDWSGQRDLRGFAALCAKHGMYLFVRIGPWAHGEARNGGLPDWLLTKAATRVNDPIYLSYVRRYYDQIGTQLKGMLWKDGGPVIGIQLENEYANRTPAGGAAHILKLKEMATQAGFDVPLYTVTGWDNAVIPPHEVVPVFGGYPDEPWSDSLREMPPDTQAVYQFHLLPNTGHSGILQAVPTANEQVQLAHYPRFTAELGGGMELTYHRRVVVGVDDIAPMALSALGSGVNLLGYYMFQGGANPEGKVTTLEESQDTDYPNDYPVRSYDFQSPLGEFGQMSASFRRLKVIHQFIRDFGTDLATMTARLPGTVPAGSQDTTTLRIAARTNGDRGFIFFNNYVRHYPLPEQKDVQVALRLPSETMIVPRKPVDMPSQSYFFWPVNMDLDGGLLKYATAQPFAKIEDRATGYRFFSVCSGVAAEFVFDGTTISELHAKSGEVSRENGRIYVRGVAASTGTAIEFQAREGKKVRIILLSPEQARNSWKVSLAGQEYLLLTLADVFSDGQKIHLRSRNASAFSISILPEGREQLSSNVDLRRTGNDGVFARYLASVETRQVAVRIEKTRDAMPSVPVRTGKIFDWRSNAVATSPEETDFERAGIWRVTLPRDALRGLSDLFLDVNYVGDVGRLYGGPLLMDDNFFNGTPWEIGLKRFSSETLEKGLVLRILPLREDAPIYLPEGSRPNFGTRSEVTEVKTVTASPEYEVIFGLGPASFH